jgi:hypothetical protein
MDDGRSVDHWQALPDGSGLRSTIAETIPIGEVCHDERYCEAAGRFGKTGTSPNASFIIYRIQVHNCRVAGPSPRCSISSSRTMRCSARVASSGANQIV